MTPSLQRAVLRGALAVGATTSSLALLGAGAAAAHVVVNSPGATQGDYAVLTFQVPTESATAGTTKLTVQLPNVASARTEPLPGWQSVVAKNGDDKATSVTWTADPGVGVTPGQFQRFAVSVGPLPSQADVSFAATQTYSDGTVVDWNQPANPDGTEPEHPAPELALAASTGHDHHAAAGGDDHSSGHTAEAAGPADDTTTTSEDRTARWLAGGGLILGALGAALGIGSVLRRRQE